MTRADARVILNGLLHAGLVVERMTPQARTEVKAALDKVLQLAEPCGECHLQDGETCNICGRTAQ